LFEKLNKTRRREKAGVVKKETAGRKEGGFFQLNDEPNV
jgi:hypothetical protein